MSMYSGKPRCLFLTVSRVFYSLPFGILTISSVSQSFHILWTDFFNSKSWRVSSRVMWTPLKNPTTVPFWASLFKKTPSPAPGIVLEIKFSFKKSCENGQNYLFTLDGPPNNENLEDLLAMAPLKEWYCQQDRVWIHFDFLEQMWSTVSWFHFGI